MNCYKYLFLILPGLAACRPSPEPINYGMDKCVYCTMTVMDNRFGAEAVTDKGKVFKFDAMECLVIFTDSHPESMDRIKFLLTNSFDKPGEFIDARNCYYLVSPNMPSPMGMNINAFADSVAVYKQQQMNTGKVLKFAELKKIIYAP